MRTFKGEKEVKAHLKTLKTHEERYYWLEHVYMGGGTVNELLDHL